jgi:twinkle protein
MRATEIAQHLSAQVESLVRMLLPNGKRIGHEWRVGSIDGEAGQSLGVHLTGEKAGVWSDFSTGASGDLIGLWMGVKNIGLREACQEALNYLGIREERLDPPPRRYQRPAKEGVQRVTPEHLAWFTDERQISPEAVEAYRIASRGDWMMFPYLRDDELIAAKYRKLPKQFRQDAECEPCLFGWQAVDPNARSAIICEGEPDAMAWYTYGFPALSVPMGGGAGAKQSWIANEFDRLALFDTLYLSMDDDKPGQDAMRELVARLGRERCRIVWLPYKDANACLMAGVPQEDMQGYLRDARTLDPAELRSAADFEDAVIAECHRIDDGVHLPWPKTHDLLKLREGETSVFAGVNGHGKSAVVNHIVADAVTHGVRACVASMEFRSPVWLKRIARLIAGNPNPTDAYLRDIMKALRGWLWVFDVAGATKADRLLDIFYYARKRYDVDLFVLDNLTKCGFADDDFSGQKRFVEMLSDFARIERTHVVIVAHMRKGDSEDHPAGKMAVKGSGGITDMVDTVVEVWRNKPLERFRDQYAHLTNPPPLPGTLVEASTYLKVLKQRATGEEPSFGLWFNKSTTQFLSIPHDMPRPLLSSPMAPGGG